MGIMTGMTGMTGMTVTGGIDIMIVTVTVTGMRTGMIEGKCCNIQMLAPETVAEDECFCQRVY